MNVSEAAVYSGKRKRSTSEIMHCASCAASGFKSLGVGEGDRIALFLRNDFAFFEASQAAKMLGAYPVPINWHSTAEETEYILNDCDAKALIVHEDLLPAIESATPAGLPVFTVPTPPEICEAYNITEKKTTLNWYDWIKTFPELETRSESKLFAVIYTSGTTGTPKGVMRLPTKSPNIMANRIVSYGLDNDGEKNVLMTGPMYHSAPNGYGSLAFEIGCNMILQPRFDAEQLLQLVERHRITHMHIVPIMFIRLLKLPEQIKKKYDLSSLKSVLHGAAPCPLEVKKAMIDWWGPVINEYYGATEAGLICLNSSEEALRKPGTVGRALPNTTLKIYSENGEELGPGEVGEIYLRCWDNADFTYIGDEQKRQDIARGDLITLGDVGYLDKEGYLFLSDRKKDMIISGGVNIYPAEIEKVLLTLPGIKDCAVFGIPDEEYGEAVCAHIELVDDTNIDVGAIKSELSQHLSKFKIPKTIKIAKSLPREDSGKIFKRKIREEYWSDRTGNI